MKISIVTATYNSAKTISDTLSSVLSQSYADFEHIIIDGKSTDNTLEIVARFKEEYGERLKVISEKDNGLYDAMNKGIALAGGDIIGILNSDDVLADADVLNDIAETFNKTGCDLSYGDIVFLDAETLTKPVRTWVAKTGNINLGWFPPHPSLYVKREIYEKIGNFDSSLKIAADYDFMLRTIKSGATLSYIPKTIVKMRAGGVSTAGLKGYLENLKESHSVIKRNNIPCPIFVDFLRIVKTLLQMIRK